MRLLQIENLFFKSISTMVRPNKYRQEVPSSIPFTPLPEKKLEGNEYKPLQIKVTQDAMGTALIAPTVDSLHHFIKVL